MGPCLSLAPPLACRSQRAARGPAAPRVAARRARVAPRRSPPAAQGCHQQPDGSGKRGAAPQPTRRVLLSDLLGNPEGLWEPEQRGDLIRLHKLLQGQEVRCFSTLKQYESLREGRTFRVAFLDPRSPSMIRQVSGDGGGGDGGCGGGATVAEHWAANHKDVAQRLGLPASRQPCLAAYCPRGQEGVFTEATYLSFPLAACAIEVYDDGGEGGLFANLAPVRPATPARHPPHWPHGLPPWVLSGAAPAPAARVPAAEDGAALAGVTGAGAPQQQDGTAVQARPLLSSYARLGFEELVKALQPPKGADADAGRITNEVFRCVSQRRGSNKWAPLGVMEGGSVAKCTHLADSFDLDLVVFVHHPSCSWDEARRCCLADCQRALEAAGWRVDGTHAPYKHLRFERCLGQLQGAAADSTLLHLDLVPLPADSFLATRTHGKKLNCTVYQSDLAPLLHALLPATEGAAGCGDSGSDGGGRGGGISGACADSMRYLRLTGVEVDVVKAQHPEVKQAMRALKAWARFGSHGVAGAGRVAGAVWEVTTMAACRREELAAPQYAAAAGAAALGPCWKPPKAFDLFLRSLEVVETRLRTASAEPVMAQVLYTAEQAERCRSMWGPGSPPFTPIMLYPADPCYNMRDRVKFSAWDALAAAAGELRMQLLAGAPGLTSDEDWQALLRSTSLAGVLARFTGF